MAQHFVLIERTVLPCGQQAGRERWFAGPAERHPLPREQQQALRRAKPRPAAQRPGNSAFRQAAQSFTLRGDATRDSQEPREGPP
jgi:hypothetical protein